MIQATTQNTSSQTRKFQPMLNQQTHYRFEGAGFGGSCSTDFSLSVVIYCSASTLPSYRHATLYRGLLELAY